MLNCKMAEFLFAVFPLKIWQDFLMRRHMQECPSCQAKLANTDEILSLLIGEEHITSSEDLWGDFQSKLEDKKRKKKSLGSFPWKWAYGIAAVFVVFAGILVMSNISYWKSAPLEAVSEDHFQINYIRVEGRPAQAYLFKSQDSDMILVWAQKNTMGE